MKEPNDDLFWTMYAQVYDLHRFLPPYQNLLYYVEKNANIRANTNMLDAGCGTGSFMKIVAEKYKVKITGIDMSDPMLAQAKIKLQGIDNAMIQKGNLNEKLPFTDKYFQSIVAINSVYAVANPQFALSELMRVLKPNGTLVIINPRANASVSEVYLEILNSVKGFRKLFIFIVTIPLLFFNVLIKLKANKKNFHFLAQEDWKRMIKMHSIKSLHIEETYRQCYMLQIIKG
jgi:ubiquinone/menaquinone biosynthesis C-methylase UbiE